MSGTVVFIPDESGTGGDERVLGEPYFDYDVGDYMVQVDQFVARPITDDELRTLARTTPSEGVGWCLNMLQPWFPGVQCVSCGRFVGRDGVISVEHFEMSSQIASVDGECRRCLDAQSDEPDHAKDERAAARDAERASTDPPGRFVAGTWFDEDEIPSEDELAKEGGA